MILASIFESFNTAFTDMVFSSVGITQKVGLLGVVIFILVEIGMTILRFFNGSGESFPNFQKPISYIVLFFFLLSYAPVMRTFDGMINIIEGYIREQGETDYLNLASDLILLKNIENAPALNKAADDASTLDDAWTDMQNSFEKIKASFRSTIEFFTFSVPALLFASIADGITGIIRYLVELLSILLTGVLIIVGPLAAMFQTAPLIGEGILKNWFSTWLSIKCWAITMSIIDMMMHKFLILFTTQHRAFTDFFLEDLGGTGVWLQVVNLTFIILFIMTPMITNYYVKGSGGAFMSKMIGAATTVIHTATGVATMGSSAVAQKALSGTMSALAEKVDSIGKKLNGNKN